MTASTTPKLKGVIPALVTPIRDDGTIDFEILVKQVRYLVDRGANGMFINGTTGEGALLSTSEKADVLRTARDASDGRAFLVAACIAPSTEQVLREIDAMAPHGPDYIAAVSPYYYAPSQEIILNHFRALSQASPVPLVLYDIPPNTHSKIELATVVALSREKNIAGIKDSSGNAAGFTRGMLHPEIPADFSWIQGDDYLDAFSLLSGASGIVTGTGNVRLEPYVTLYNAALKGDRDGALSAQREINALCGIFEQVGGRVIPAIKAATALDGRCLPRMKMAYHTLASSDISKVRDIMQSLGLHA